MKKIILLSLLSSSLLAGNAFAHESKSHHHKHHHHNHYYLKVTGGYSMVNAPETGVTYQTAKIKDTFLAGVSAGKCFEYLRAELSFTYRDNFKFSNQDVFSLSNNEFSFLPMRVKAYTEMVDLYKDFDFKSVFTPYVMLGLGATQFSTGAYTLKTVDHSGPTTDYTSTAGKTTSKFSWRAGFGVSYHFESNPNFALELGYSYARLGKFYRYNQYTDVNDRVKIISNEFNLALKMKI